MSYLGGVLRRIYGGLLSTEVEGIHCCRQTAVLTISAQKSLGSPVSSKIDWARVVIV